MTYVRIRGHENYVKDPNAGPRTVREEDDEAEENHDQREEEEEEEEEDDGWLYDPKVIQPADIDWTENCRVLGINAYCTRLSKYAVTSRYISSNLFNMLSD
jgi:hypothetical protein